LTADLAIDGDVSTASKTNCARNTDLWFKMSFNAIHCFSEIVIKIFGQNRWQMHDVEVHILNNQKGTESLCGILKVSDNSTTYSIPCDLGCGDEVKLKLRHDKTYAKSGCIQIREITAFGSEKDGKFRSGRGYHCSVEWGEN
jgi:hypothetical protein